MNYPTYRNITRIKNVSRKDNEETGETAYLNIEEREFVLHFPDVGPRSILKPGTDELIILYQRINKTRYFTHLVQPIDDEIFEERDRTAFKFGRWVKAVAYTGEENKIPFELAHLDLRN